jgi:hypothetical protein
MSIVLKRFLTAMPVVIGLAFLGAAPQLVAADPTIPTATPPPSEASEPAGEPARLVPFERDRGPSDTAIDAAAPITDTLIAALDDYLAVDKAATQSEGMAVFGETIPARPVAAATAVYLPMVAGVRQVLPGPVDPGPVEPPPPGADVTVVAWPTPSIRAARDSIISYEIRLYNDGRGRANSTTVTVPFDPNQLTLVGSDMDRAAGDWVSEVRSNAVVVTFGALGDQRSRLAYVYFRVNRLLADNTVLNVRPSYRWSDARGTTERSANWAPVVVGGGNENGAYLWMIVQPVSGLPGELRTFYSNRFVPGELVTTWLNTRNGVIALDITANADGLGQVWLDYRPERLAPGSYQLVAYGNKSRRAAVATFILR